MQVRHYKLIQEYIQVSEGIIQLILMVVNPNVLEVYYTVIGKEEKAALTFRLGILFSSYPCLYDKGKQSQTKA